jgi:hypothetical protein
MCCRKHPSCATAWTVITDLLLSYHYGFETLIMSNYRRLYIRGGTYFCTVVAYRRQLLFTDDARVELLRHAFREVKAL